MFYQNTSSARQSSAALARKTFGIIIRTGLYNPHTDHFTWLANILMNGQNPPAHKIAECNILTVPYKVQAWNIKVLWLPPHLRTLPGPYSKQFEHPLKPHLITNIKSFVMMMMIVTHLLHILPSHQLPSPAILFSFGKLLWNCGNKRHLLPSQLQGDKLGEKRSNGPLEKTMVTLFVRTPVECLTGIVKLVALHSKPMTHWVVAC